MCTLFSKNISSWGNAIDAIAAIARDVAVDRETREPRNKKRDANSSFANQTVSYIVYSIVPNAIAIMFDYYRKQDKLSVALHCRLACRVVVREIFTALKSGRGSRSSALACDYRVARFFLPRWRG